MASSDYRDSAGLPESPIWLLADSRPRKVLTREPLDSRHPTRHTIWTPVLDHMQEHVFEACRSRLDTRNIYVRNAVEDKSDRRSRAAVNEAIDRFRRLANASRPILVFCFGGFAFELALRACEESGSTAERWREWRIEDLGAEFGSRIVEASAHKINILPLLHAIVARKFDECDEKYFPNGAAENYFQFTGRRIADALIRLRSVPRVTALFR